MSLSDEIGPLPGRTVATSDCSRVAINRMDESPLSAPAVFVVAL